MYTTSYKIHKTRTGRVKGRTVSTIGVTPDGRNYERRSTYITEREAQEYKRLVQKYNYRVEGMAKAGKTSSKLEQDLQLLGGEAFTPSKRTGSLKELASMRDHKAEIRRLRKLTRTRKGESATESFAAHQILIVKHRFINAVKRIIDDALITGMQNIGQTEYGLFEQIKNKILYMNRQRFIKFVNNTNMGFEYLYLDHLGDDRKLEKVLRSILEQIDRF